MPSDTHLIWIGKSADDVWKKRRRQPHEAQVLCHSRQVPRVARSASRDANGAPRGFLQEEHGQAKHDVARVFDEALCFGWIDGVRRSLGDEMYSIRFTPRKPTSIWSVVNVARVARLEKVGRMMPAGLRAFAARAPDRTGVYSFERNTAATLAPQEEKKLRANAAAFAFFEAQPTWYRRAAIHWVISAKRDETRERRLGHLIADSAGGRTIPPLTRPATKGATRKDAREVTGYFCFMNRWRSPDGRHSIPRRNAVRSIRCACSRSRIESPLRAERVLGDETRERT